jgi:hypothetical protein
MIAVPELLMIFLGIALVNLPLGLVCGFVASKKGYPFWRGLFIGWLFGIVGLVYLALQDRKTETPNLSGH